MSSTAVPETTEERVSHAPPRWLWPALIAPFVLPYLFNAVVDRFLEHDGPQFSDLIFADAINVNRSLAADVWSGPLESGAHARGTVAVEDVDTFEATVAAAAESVGSRALCVMLHGEEAGAFVADVFGDQSHGVRTLVCNVYWHPDILPALTDGVPKSS
jgi:hypothetical protein